MSSVDAKRELELFFATPKEFYFDEEVSRLSHILKHNGMHTWSLTPRLYLVLYEIGYSHLISSFLSAGITDDSFPLDESNLKSTPIGSYSNGIQRFQRSQDRVIVHDVTVYQERLNAYFPPARDLEKLPLHENDFEHVSRLAKFCHLEKAHATPKLFYLLRFIGAVDSLQTFHSGGFNDMWFPYPRFALSGVLQDKSKANAFLQSQGLVYNSHWSEGPHLNFASDDHEHLEQVKELGSGGAGFVDHVYCPTLRKNYARKILQRNPDGLRMFANEIKLLKAVRHHHCVSFAGSYTDIRVLAILAEPVADMNLGTFLDITPLSHDRKELLMTSFGCLSVALGYLHDNGIRHKDIKPQNILIHFNTLILTDFGLSADSFGNTTSLVDDGFRIDERADIWSMGCVFMEVVAALHDVSIAKLKEYFKSVSNGRLNYKDNPDAPSKWVADSSEDLSHLGVMALTALSLVPVMLNFQPDSRPTSKALMETFGACHSDENVYNTCCRAELLRAASSATTAYPIAQSMATREELSLGTSETVSLPGHSIVVHNTMAPSVNLSTEREEHLDGDFGLGAAETDANLQSLQNPIGGEVPSLHNMGDVNDAEFPRKENGRSIEPTYFNSRTGNETETINDPELAGIESFYRDAPPAYEVSSSQDVAFGIDDVAYHPPSTQKANQLVDLAENNTHRGQLSHYVGPNDRKLQHHVADRGPYSNYNSPYSQSQATLEGQPRTENGSSAWPPETATKSPSYSDSTQGASKHPLVKKGASIIDSRVKVWKDRHDQASKWAKRAAQSETATLIRVRTIPLIESYQRERKTSVAGGISHGNPNQLQPFDGELQLSVTQDRKHGGKTKKEKHFERSRGIVQSPSPQSPTIVDSSFPRPHVNNHSSIWNAPTTVPVFNQEEKVDSHPYQDNGSEGHTTSGRLAKTDLPNSREQLPDIDQIRVMQNLGARAEPSFKSTGGSQPTPGDKRSLHDFSITPKPQESNSHDVNSFKPGVTEELVSYGSYTGSLPRLLQNIEESKLTKGEGHPDTVSYMFRAANGYKDLQQFGHAEAMYRKVLDFQTKIPGKEASYTQVAMNSLAFCLKELGRESEALAIYREVLEIRKRMFGKKHPATRMAQRCHDILYSEMAPQKKGLFDRMLKK